MTVAVLNPGTSRIQDASELQAIANIEQFVKDLDAEEVHCKRKPKQDGDGYFGFRVKVNGHKFHVDMPGLPLDQMRYFRGANPWRYQRLYLDGYSFLWEYALDIVDEQAAAQEGGR